MFGTAEVFAHHLTLISGGIINPRNCMVELTSIPDNRISIKFSPDLIEDIVNVEIPLFTNLHDVSTVESFKIQLSTIPSR